jgi:hypothetical protein
VITIDAPCKDGVVYVVSPQGQLVARILVEGPEISGVVVRSVTAVLHFSICYDVISDDANRGINTTLSLNQLVSRCCV